MDLRNNSTYFLPFSRNSIYASMQPISLNLTLMNPTSLHSTILSYYLETDDPGCFAVSLRYPKMVWPFFGNIRVNLETFDTPACRNLSLANIEVKVHLIVKNLEPKKAEELNVEQVTFRLLMDFVPTPAREKRVLID